MKQPLIILTGPTASGKTALSVALAKRIGGEIISADSMQVYRHMDMGSAKVTKEEMDGDPPPPHRRAGSGGRLQRGGIPGYGEKGHGKGSTRKTAISPLWPEGRAFISRPCLYDIDFTENDGDMEYRHRAGGAGSRRKAPPVLHEMLMERGSGIGRGHP